MGITEGSEIDDCLDNMSEKISSLLSYRINLLSRAIDNGGQIGTMRRHNLTIFEARSLGYLSEIGPTTISNLARRMFSDPARMSRIIKTLVERNFVECHPNPVDGRSVVVALTPYGEEVTNDVARFARLSHEIIRMQLTDGEYEALDHGITKIIDFLTETGGRSALMALASKLETKSIAESDK